MSRCGKRPVFLPTPLSRIPGHLWCQECQERKTLQPDKAGQPCHMSTRALLPSPRLAVHPLSPGETFPPDLQPLLLLYGKALQPSASLQPGRATPGLLLSPALTGLGHPLSYSWFLMMAPRPESHKGQCEPGLWGGRGQGQERAQVEPSLPKPSLMPPPNHGSPPPKHTS